MTAAINFYSCLVLFQHRLLTLLSTSTYKAELQKVAHTVLAEYLTGMQKQTLHTTVKVGLYSNWIYIQSNLSTTVK